MEDPIIKPQSEKESKYNFKHIFISFIAGIIFTICFVLFFAYKSWEKNKAKEAALQKYELKHRGAVSDSLKRVQKAIEEYNSRVLWVHKIDSAKKSLRYSTGDVVYLKPDSAKGVIFEISIDSTMMRYNYFLLLEGQKIITSGEKLIY